MKRELLETIRTAAERDSSCPVVVGLQAYFEGNTSEDCIAPNQVGYGRPALAELYEVFRRIESRPDVQTVLVGIHDDWTEALEDPDTWPAAENVYIYTTAKRAEVETWIDGLMADGVVKGWPYGKHASAPKTEKGYTVYAVCWD